MELAAAGVMDANLIVSVCIANYNGMKVIDECLQSVLTQQGEIALEVLVHDDASSDGSAAYIRERYPHARLIVSDNNVGFCVANNRMAAAAKGKYLLLLNNDAALYPDALLTLLTEATRLDQPAILGLPQYDAATGRLIDIGSQFDLFLNPVPNQNPNRNEVGMIIGACLWVPRALWNELGGFPQWFHTLAEDMYLCARARLTGHSVRVIGKSGFRHQVGNSLGGGKITSENRLVTSMRRRAFSERNKTFVMVLTYPGVVLVVALPLHLLLIIVEGILLSLIKCDATLWRTIYAPIYSSLWERRDKLFCLRKEIQAKRNIGLREWMAVFRLRPYKLEMLLKHGLPEVR